MTWIPLSIAPEAQRQQVRIVQVDPPGPEVVAEWDPPDLGRGGGDPRWDVYQRPGRVDGQEYVGQELHSRAITLTFDGWGRSGRGRHLSVERQCQIVHAWSLPVGGHGSGTWPPRLRVAYGPWQQQLWRVERLRWAAPLIINGTRVRQDVTIELREYLAPALLLSPVEQAAQNAGGESVYGRRPGSGRTYTVVPGDHLYGIALAQLGDAARWPEIAELNDITDPYIIQPGDVLQLP